MSTSFTPIIKFFFKRKDCRRAWIEMEPFLSEFGFGIIIKVILEKTKTNNNEVVTYHVVDDTLALTQKTLETNNFLYDVIHDFFEHLYLNKVESSMSISICAMILHFYFKDIVYKYGIDLSAYIKDIEYKEKHTLGF